ncbi:hypothetical protein Csa_019648 [Cucumis sativus]|uniref:Uncharacterized protein n=1 Tax=Cucumis sativus TaxID=3659 RepID=A0A0A0LW11_CUCSA|nr:hypothetical protein Csa_019648 [Cucumis sativus]
MCVVGSRDTRGNFGNIKSRSFRLILSSQSPFSLDKQEASCAGEEPQWCAEPEMGRSFCRRWHLLAVILSLPMLCSSSVFGFSL